MKNEKVTILSNVPVARDVWKMDLAMDLPAQAGQFVEVKCGEYFLRRPISICESRNGVLTLIYKVVGKGTDVLSRLQAGSTVEVFGPLGTGYPACEGSVVLMGGGVGAPPLVKTARDLQAQGCDVQVILGFGSREDVFGLDLFVRLGITPVVATMDGSLGIQGTVLDAMKAADVQADQVMACGPIPMLKAVSEAFDRGYVSLESRMACGIGACMGCVVETVDGSLVRVCKDGPVFPIGKVVL